MASLLPICFLILLHTAATCDLACLRGCSSNCAATCSCLDASSCLSQCQTHLISPACASLCSPHLAAVDKRLLPKPQSVSTTGPFEAKPSDMEDFELTKTERCKATCLTFCEINEKPGLCPGMCELLFCFQSMETYVPVASEEMRHDEPQLSSLLLLGTLGAAVACIVCMAKKARAASQKEVMG